MFCVVVVLVIIGVFIVSSVLVIVMVVDKICFGWEGIVVIELFVFWKVFG